MSNLFERRYSLIVGRPQSTTASNEIDASTSNFKTKQLTQAGVKSKTYVDANFIEIKDLSLKGMVKYSRTSNARDKDDATLVLRGLTKEVKDFIQQGDILLLSAGYKQDEQLPLILSGEVVAKKQQTAVAGDELTLTVSQSFSALRNIKIVRSWPPSDANLYVVLRDITDLLVRSGIDFGSRNLLTSNRALLESEKFNGGYSVEGNAFAVLDKVLTTYGLRSYFANDVLYIEPKDFPAVTETFIIEPNNLKAPTEISQKITKKKSKRNIQTGYVFTLFLDGRIKLNGKLRVPDGEFRGDYIITSIEHHLDYENKNWHTKVLCQREEV